jgi:hypothetical protein
MFQAISKEYVISFGLFLMERLSYRTEKNGFCSYLKFDFVIRTLITVFIQQKYLTTLRLLTIICWFMLHFSNQFNPNNLYLIINDFLEHFIHQPKTNFLSFLMATFYHSDLDLDYSISFDFWTYSNSAKIYVVKVRFFTNVNYTHLYQIKNLST